MLELFGHDHFAGNSTQTVVLRGHEDPYAVVNSTLPSLLHLLSQAKRSHISPHFIYIGQTVRFQSRLTYIVPAQRYFPVSRPDRVLLFVVNHYFVNCRIFTFVLSHLPLPFELFRSVKLATLATGRQKHIQFFKVFRQF